MAGAGPDAGRQNADRRYWPPGGSAMTERRDAEQSLIFNYLMLLSERSLTPELVALRVPGSI
jgi:hypothetical protein